MCLHIERKGPFSYFWFYLLPVSYLRRVPPANTDEENRASGKKIVVIALPGLI